LGQSTLIREISGLRDKKNVDVDTNAYLQI
jgi:hypothetical protein